jgi:glycosyltransferase 2 family protein
LNRTLRNLLVLALTVGLLVLFFWKSDPGEVWRLIRTMNLGWFAIGIAANLAALFFRADRWRRLLSPTTPPPFYPTFFSVSVGYLASSILPIRAGDVVRAALMKKKSGTRISAAIATVLAERVLDLLAILLMMSLFVGLTIRDPEFAPGQMVLLESVGLVTAILLVAMTSFLLGITFFTSSIRVMHVRLGRFLPERFEEAWMHFFDTFTGSFRVAKYPRAFLRVLGLTVLTWTCLASQFWFVAKALGHELPFRSSFLMTGVTIIGLMLPTPGGIGGFHKATQMALISFYGFDLDVSVAVAVVYHIVGTAPVVLVGTLLLLREGLSYRQLTEIGEKPEE